MELKDFIKSVLFDVTEAVKECQEELKNGAIISPSNRSAEEKVRAVSGDLKIYYVRIMRKHADEAIRKILDNLK